MDSHYTKSVLPNGLNLLTIPMLGVESVTVLAMVRVGSRNETEKIRGLSHFLEHMPFKGTKKFPNSLSLASSVDARGAEFNAFTGKEYTGFYVKAAKNHLEFSLDILSQLLFHPLIDKTEMEREKGVILEELNMYEDQPMAKAGLDFESLLYGNTSLGWETIGTKETLKNMQRQDFIDYMNMWYQPGNMTIGIAGAIPKLQTSNFKLQALVAKYFNSAKKKSGKLIRQNYVFSQDKPQIFIRTKKTEQAHLCLGVRTFGRTNPRRYTLAVLSTVLGGNMSSRLFIQVRERRGLAYYVRTSPETYLDNGYLMTQAGTAINKALEAIKVILEEYNKTLSANRRKKILNTELTKAKEFLKGRLILGLEDSKEMASLYVEDFLMEGKARTPKEILTSIDQVTQEDIVKLAGEIFQPQNLNLSIIGPYKDSDRQGLEKILQ